VPREARVQDFSSVESVHLLGNSLDVTVAPNKMTTAGFKEGGKLGSCPAAEGCGLWAELVSFLPSILAVLVELRLVTDRHTQTDRHRPMASTAHA